MNPIRYLTHDTSAALLAWALTSFVSIFLLIQEGVGLVQLSLSCVGFLLFALLLVRIAGNPEPPSNKDYMLLGLEFVVICFLYFVVPYDYIAILTVIWSSQVAWFIPMNRALLLSLAWSSPLWLVGEFYWENDDSWATAILFWTFNVFGIFMIAMTKSEQAAKGQIERQKRELESAHFLLRETAGLSERIRIARDIHDMIGHQLTALSINLQATEKYCLRESNHVPEVLRQSRALARDLLTDIRVTVREIRDNRPLNLEEAINKLTQHLPRITFNTQYLLSSPITDVATAEILLRFFQECVSNSLRHGQATSIQLKIQDQGRIIRGTVEDNGLGLSDLSTEGTGFKGLRERADSANGAFTVCNTGRGVKAEITLLMRDESA